MKSTRLNSVLLLIIMGLFVGCAKDTIIDKRLNGLWVDETGETISIRMNNGYVEYLGLGNGNPISKGTYITKNGYLISTITHLFAFDQGEWITVEEFYGNEISSQESREKYEIKNNKLSIYRLYTDVDGNEIVYEIILTRKE